MANLSADLLKESPESEARSHGFHILLIFPTSTLSGALVIDLFDHGRPNQADSERFSLTIRTLRLGGTGK